MLACGANGNLTDRTGNLSVSLPEVFMKDWILLFKLHQYGPQLTWSCPSNSGRVATDLAFSSPWNANAFDFTPQKVAFLNKVSKNIKCQHLSGELFLYCQCKSTKWLIGRKKAGTPRLFHKIMWYDSLVILINRFGVHMLKWIKSSVLYEWNFVFITVRSS